jgi:hypothetical protein
MKLLNISLILGLTFYGLSLKGQSLMVPNPSFKAYWIKHFSVNSNRAARLQFKEVILLTEGNSCAKEDSMDLKETAILWNSALLKGNSEQETSLAIIRLKNRSLKPIVGFQPIVDSKQKNLKVGPLHPSITNWIAVDPTTILNTDCGISIEARKMEPTLSLLLYYTLSGDAVEPISYNLELVLSANF